jgi:hypothetical protein
VNNRFENGKVEIYNQKNELWKGEIKSGKKWNGEGIFDWKDRKDNIWVCKGKQK